jgi:hypothetical protein
MREIEANPVLTAVDRNGFYNSINILHSVPRFNNPTGTFDNDQYLLTIYTKVGINTSAFLTQLQAILDYCCPHLAIEHYNGNCAAFSTTTTTTTTAAPSDVRLKQNVIPTGNKVGGFNEYNWEWNDTAKSLNLDGYPTVGVLAQEVMKSRPDLVVFDESIGFYKVNYNALNKA